MSIQTRFWLSSSVHVKTTPVTEVPFEVLGVGVADGSVAVGVGVADEEVAVGVGVGVALVVVWTVSIFPATGHAAPATTLRVGVGVELGDGLLVAVGDGVTVASAWATAGSVSPAPVLMEPITKAAAPTTKPILDAFAELNRAQETR